MTNERQRRLFTKEFKTEAVELALRSNKPMADIARAFCFSSSSSSN